MSRLCAACVCILLAGLASAQERTKETFAKVAERIVAAINAADYEGVRKDFNQGMLKVFPVEKCKEFMHDVAEQFGKINKLEAPEFKSAAKAVFLGRCQRGLLDFTLILDDKGRVSGVLFERHSDLPVPEQNETKLALPFAEKWLVVWGGDSAELNHHHESRSQRFAFDFVGVGADGKTHQGDGKQNEDYHAFGRDVLAPADGVVTEVIEGVRDNVPGSLNPLSALGNAVFIQHRKHEVSVLAHFKQGSTRVKAGDTVEKGQVLGLCGNSGNSSEPHLHYHLQNTAVIQDATGIKSYFDDVVVDKDGGKTVKIRYSPIRHDIVQPQAKVDRPSAEEFQKQAARLSPRDSKAAILKALSWIRDNHKAPSAPLTIPALEKCTQHRDAVVRKDAVFTLGMVADKHRKPCPLVVVNALLDKDEDTRQAAGHAANRFRAFETGCLDVLLRCAESEHVPVRVYALDSLFHAGPKDGRVNAALEKAQRDEAFSVRHNARAALFRATDNLDDFLRYLVRLREEPDAILAPLPRDKKLRDKDLSTRRLGLIATIGFLVPEWSEKRPEELARILMKCLDDPSPFMRRGAARVIACCVWKPADDADQEEIRRVFLPNDKDEFPQAKDPQKPRQKSKVTLQFEKLNVRERLAQLRDGDGDVSVREVARAALASLSRSVKPLKR